MHSIFSNLTQLEAESECIDCVGGSYCETPGLIEPTGLCQSGSYCTLGAGTSAPRDNTTGNICPAGQYCPIGSEVGIPCPAGTYNPSEGMYEVVYTWVGNFNEFVLNWCLIENNYVEEACRPKLSL